MAKKQKAKKTKKGEPKKRSVNSSSNSQKSIGILPLGDRVIVMEIKANEPGRTESGIYIPETANNDKGSKRGKVVAVGDGKLEDGKSIPLKVKVGDNVLFSWGDTFSYDDMEYVIVRESDIIGIIK